MAKQSAANIALMARLDEIGAEIHALDAQSLTVDDVRNTIHRIADQIAAIADAIPAIAARLEELARWVAVVTEAGPAGPGPTEPQAGARPSARPKK
jgi:methyl-accepting chemotaxis protein